MTPRMLDLFSGRGGASRAMVDRGWSVTRVELDERFPADHRDIRTYHPEPGAFDLVWASPPCTEFSRESMSWCRTGNPPSMALVGEALRVVQECRPRWWVLENVRGAVGLFRAELGVPLARLGPVFLWGNPPAGMLWPRVGAYKERISGKRPDLRSQIPYEIGYALAIACERHMEAA